MATIVTFSLVVLGVALVIGAVIIFFGVRRAQHGFEDHEGFHRNNRPKRNHRNGSNGHTGR